MTEDNEPRGASAAIPAAQRRPRSLPKRHTRTSTTLLDELAARKGPPPHMAPPELQKPRVKQKVYKRPLDIERADARLLTSLQTIKEIDKRLAKADAVPPDALLGFCRSLRRLAHTIRRNLDSLVESERNKGNLSHVPKSVFKGRRPA